VQRLGGVAERVAAAGQTPVLLCGAALRPHLRRLLERYLPTLILLSPPEIAPTVRIRSLGVVTLDED
jgi:flagellar biosynthesis protein FlhA